MNLQSRFVSSIPNRDWKANMATIQQLEDEINKIKERNRRVETEKSWETSWTRKIMIAVLTYIVITVFFIFIGNPNPLGNAIIPSIAFILSTLSGPLIKRFWLQNIHKG